MGYLDELKTRRDETRETGFKPDPELSVICPGLEAGQAPPFHWGDGDGPSGILARFERTHTGDEIKAILAGIVVDPMD